MQMDIQDYLRSMVEDFYKYRFLGDDAFADKHMEKRDDFSVRIGEDVWIRFNYDDHRHRKSIYVEVDGYTILTYNPSDSETPHVVWKMKSPKLEQVIEDALRELYGRRSKKMLEEKQREQRERAEQEAKDDAFKTKWGVTS